jgi:chemotaxis protein MotB
MKGQIETLQQQGATLAQQNTELRSRATTLDKDNQELESLLAQSQQQTRVLEDQVSAVREQLRGATTQLVRSKVERDQTAKKVDVLEASVKRRAAATITANNSLRSQLPKFNIPGVEVRVDADVIRVELPGSQLFASGDARLLPQAARLIDQVAGEVVRMYPQQIIGIEGHTDSDPIAHSNRWLNNHQLSVGRAMAVFNHLVSRTHLNPRQLFVVGHATNHPVVSNGTPSGRERNRRVELVIYPERVSTR